MHVTVAEWIRQQPSKLSYTGSNPVGDANTSIKTPTGR